MAAVLFVTIFLHGDLMPVNIMEARNFITAREMIAGGSWLLPTMNGELRIAKPPLPTWITAVFMQWAGTDADLVVNRIPSGLSALLLAAFTYLLARRTTGEKGTAMRTLLVLATSYLFMFSARKNEWDIFSITFMTGAVWALAEILSRSRGRTLYLFIFSILMSCAFYSKGPVPFWVMLAPFVASYAVTFGLKDFRANRWGLLWAFILCMVICSAWPLYVYLHTPHAAAAVASKETAGWFTRHTQPPWFYLLHFQEVVGFWVFFLLYGLAAAFIRKDWKPQEKIFVLWFILTIASITIFPEKKLRYLLPAVVPGAVVSAMAIRRLLVGPGRARKIVFGAFCLITGPSFVVAAGALIHFSQGRVLPLIGVPFLVCAAAGIIYLYVKNKEEMTPLFAVAGICMCLVFLPPVLGSQLGQDEAAPFMHLRDGQEYRGRTFYSLGELPAEVIWASGRAIRPLTENELALRTSSACTFIVLTDMDKPLEVHGSRLLEWIPAGRKTYFVYRVDGEGGTPSAR